MSYFSVDDLIKLCLSECSENIVIEPTSFRHSEINDLWLGDYEFLIGSLIFKKHNKILYLYDGKWDRALNHSNNPMGVGNIVLKLDLFKDDLNLLAHHVNLLIGEIKDKFLIS